MPRSAGNPGLAERLRAVAADALELAQVRLELFSLEAREASLRLVTLAALAVGGVAALSFGLGFLAVFITVLLWDTHRLWALGVFTVVFLAGGGILLMLARSCLKGLADLFAATRGEWQRDRERLSQGQASAPAEPAQKDDAP